MFPFQIDDQAVTMSTEVKCGFLGYHQEELMYWVGVISRLKSSTSQAESPESVMEDANLYIPIQHK